MQGVKTKCFKNQETCFNARLSVSSIKLSRPPDTGSSPMLFFLLSSSRPLSHQMNRVGSMVLQRILKKTLPEFLDRIKNGYAGWEGEMVV